MSVDTKINILMIQCDVEKTVNKIVEVLKSNLPIFGEIEVRLTHEPSDYDSNAPIEERERMRINHYEMRDINFALDYECDQFDSGKEERRLWLHYDHYEGGNMLYLSVGCWGHNEDIARCLVDNFGGYADFSDCDDIGIDYAMPQPKVKEPA